MGLESVVLRCGQCELEWDDLIERSTRDGMHTCPECLTMTATRKFTAPNVVGKESYLDGRRIKNDDTYRKVAEAARLESKMFNEPPEKRGDMQKELRKLRGYADSKEKPSRDGGNGK